MWLIGIPLIVLLDTVSADASYLIRAFLIHIFSVALPSLLVWPRIYKWAEQKFVKDDGRRSRPTINMTGRSELHVSGVNASVLSGPSGQITGVGQTFTRSNTPNSNSSEQNLENERVAQLERKICVVEQRLSRQTYLLQEKEELLRRVKKAAEDESPEQSEYHNKGVHFSDEER